MADKQEALMEKLQESEFVAIELNLYLDTHPDDMAALHDYNYAVDNSRMLAARYEASFGPLYNFGLQNNSDKSWQWINSPWPWEM
jgi:spore coat protein JB